MGLYSVISVKKVLSIADMFGHTHTHTHPSVLLIFSLSLMLYPRVNFSLTFSDYILPFVRLWSYRRQGCWTIQMVSLTPSGASGTELGEMGENGGHSLARPRGRSTWWAGSEQRGRGACADVSSSCSAVAVAPGSSLASRRRVGQGGLTRQSRVRLAQDRVGVSGC